MPFAIVTIKNSANANGDDSKSAISSYATSCAASYSASYNYTNYGNVWWHGYYSLDAYINGVRGFCGDFSKYAAASGSNFNYKLSEDVNTTRILLGGTTSGYKWSGFSDSSCPASESNAWILFTAYGLSQYHANVIPNSSAYLYNYGKFQSFLDYCKSITVPNNKLTASKSSVGYAGIRNGYKISESITINGPKQNYITMTIPQSLAVYKNGDYGTAITGTVNLYGGDSFCFAAPMTYSQSYSTGAMGGHVNDYCTWFYECTDTTKQPVFALGTYDRTSISITVNFADKSGSLTINPNGGEYNGSSQESSYPNVAGSILNINNPTKKNSEFVSWLPEGKGIFPGFGTATYGDGFFRNGTNGVSAYSWGGNVTVERVKNTGPTDSSCMLEVTTTDKTSPGLGGIQQVVGANYWTTWEHVLVAKIPKGYSLQFKSNAAGNGSHVTWVTSNEGTGNWEVYRYHYEAGISGTINTTNTLGYICLNGNDATTDHPVKWQICYAEIFKDSDGSIRVYDTSGSGNTYIDFVDPSDDCPGKDNKMIQVTNKKEATPGEGGGFYQPKYTQPGKRYKHSFYAKIPTGTTLTNKNNILGDYPEITWNTSNKGTGSWEYYEYTVKVNYTGTFRDFGYIALSGKHGTETDPLIWYVCDSKIEEIQSKYPDQYYITAKTNHNSGISIGSGSYVNGGNAVYYANNINGLFTFIEKETGYYGIVSSRSGRELADYNASTSEGAQVVQWLTNNGDNQKWKITENNDGTVSFIHKLTGMAISMDDSYNSASKIVLKKYTGSDTQRFYLLKAKTLQGYNTGSSYIYDNGTGKMTAFWKDGNTVSYTVNHWKQKKDGDVSSKDEENYSLDETELLSALPGAEVTPSVKKYTGFISPDAQTVTANSDGNTVVNYYYTRKQYKISYHANEGINLPKDQIKLYDVDSVISSTKPTLKGHVFEGWNTEEDGSGDDYFPEDDYTENEDLTLYAQWMPIKYTVTYDGNGSTSGSMLTQTFTYGTSYNLAANGFVRSNYHFAGWNTKADGSGTSYADKQSVKNLASTYGAKITLYAQWVKNTYTIRFHANGGAGSMADVTVPYDTSYKLPANKFTYQGYTFDKWKTEDGTGVYGNEAAIKYSSSQLKNGVLNLYAQWKINQYTLTITGDSGVETITGNGTYNYGTTANVTYQIKPGYHIKNITGTTADGDPNGAWTGHTGKSGTVTDTWTVKACNRTIVVHTEPNTYTVKYDGNGNTGGSTASSNHTYGTAKALTANGYTKTGYSFNGWNTKADGSGTAYADEASVKNLTTTNGGTVTLYAQWTKNFYYLDLNGWLDGKSVGNITGYGTADIYVDGVQKANDVTDFYQKIPYGSKYEIKDIKTVTGHTYVGVHSGSITGTIGASNVGVVLEFKTNKYTVTFDKNNGTGTMADQTFTYGVKQALTKNAFTRTGYTFKNWNTQADGKGTAYTDQQEVTSLSDADGASVKLYAQWTANTYTVKYDGNGSTGGSTANSSHTYDTAKSLTANGFTRTGYTFKGWNTKADGIGTSYADKASVKNLSSTNGATVTLYAQWTAKKYTVTYNANGGTGTMAADTATYGSGYVTKVNTFSKTGYTFAGWNEKADGSGTDWTGWIGKSWTWTYTKDITLYAQWKINTYALIYDPSGGTVTPTSKSLTYGSAYGTLPTPTRKGYAFMGWFTAASGGSQASEKATIGAGNVTIYAHWKAYTLTINYHNDGAETWLDYPSGKTIDIAKKDIVKTETVAYDATYDHAVNGVLDVNRFTKTGYHSGSQWKVGSKDSTVLISDQDGPLNNYGTNGQGVASFLGVAAELEKGDVTVELYPKFIANTYTIKFDKNGGVGTIKDQKFTYDQEQALTESTFSRTGYTFISWNTKADGSGTSYAATETVKNLTVTNNGMVTLYAQWSINYYYLDLNGWLDGKSAGNITGYGTADIYVNGVQKANDVTDFYQKIPYGSKYEIKDIKTVTGHTYVGVHSGSVTGTIGTSNVGVVLEFKTNKYTVTFDKNNGTGTMPNQSFTYGVSQALTANTLTKTGYIFSGWNTKADGSGTTFGDKQKVTNLTTMDGTTVTLYAQWTANQYTIVFNANGGTGTMANQELTYDKAATLNANTFKRTGYRFNGWNTKADGTGTSYADKASVKNLTASNGGTVTLYAKWYSAVPELEAKDATYYEGQDITKAMLLKNVTKASDVEDGDMAGKVIITKIEYSAGKLVDGKPQAAYTKSWTNGMPDSEKLDTWFQQLPKEKAPVTHKITYQVTDLSGKTTTKTSTITVKYNEFPVIKAEDRYFTLEEAKSGKITKDVLLKEAIASGKLKAEDKEDGVISNKVTILDYKDTDFKNVNGNATVTVIFKVNDSMGPSGVGKETVCEVKVKIIDSGSDYWRDDDGTARKQVRFITQKYYDKNKDTDFHGMTSEEIEASSDNGGLNVMSKWYQNAAYKALLTGSFAKDAGTDYKISAEKAKELKQKIESNGIGNSKSSNALTDIYNSLK